MLTRLFVFLMLIAAPATGAETGKPAYVPPAPVVTTESMVQMMGGLLLVLAVIGGLVWFAKRFSLIPAVSAGTVKVIAATGVGQRERVVVVEIENTWLVLGIAPGRVNKLHTMEKPQSSTTNVCQDNPATGTFAAQLDQSIKKEHVE